MLVTHPFKTTSLVLKTPLDPHSLHLIPLVLAFFPFSPTSVNSLILQLLFLMVIGVIFVTVLTISVIIAHLRTSVSNYASFASLEANYAPRPPSFDSSSWLVDTGGNFHMVPDLAGFDQFTPTPTGASLQVGNGKSLPVHSLASGPLLTPYKFFSFLMFYMFPQ